MALNVDLFKMGFINLYQKENAGHALTPQVMYLLSYLSPVDTGAGISTFYQLAPV
jgi:hypothetical protein